MRIMRVNPVVLRLSQAGAALTGRGCTSNLVGMALRGLPKHQPQIHFGRQGGGAGQLPIPGAGTDWYLAAHDRERHASFSFFIYWSAYT